MSSRSRNLLKLAAVIAVTFGAGMTFAQAFNLPRAGLAATRVDAERHQAAPAAAAGRRRVEGAPPSFADVADRVNPAVVYVQTRQQQQGQRNDPSIPPEFQDFFRRFQQQQGPRIRQGSGSGFIVSRDGYILTNNHVVEDANQVTVRLLDNREFTARVVGRDPNTDVAVIKIDATGLPTVSFGNSDDTRVGDWVLAVGNPLGFTFTVTAGIVSAKGRGLAGLRDPDLNYTIQDFIQTDAAINPGNSGGPLVDLDGEVIGINSAIASNTGFYSGYGFAIPINLARHVMDELIANGRVSRSVLGIRIGEITPDAAAYVGLQSIHGVVVGGFPDDTPSPARDAGLQVGDVIVALNDSAIDHVAQLQQMVGFRHPGESVRVTVVRREGDRRGVRRTFDVRLIRAPEDNTARTASRDDDSDSAKPTPMEGRLGIRVEDLPQDASASGRIPADQRGVVVTDVEEGGPAWQRLVGPEEGGPDLITWVNSQRVRNVQEFQRAIRSVGRGDVVQLRVYNVQGRLERVVYIRSRQ